LTNLAYSTHADPVKLLDGINKKLDIRKLIVSIDGHDDSNGQKKRKREIRKHSLKEFIEEEYY
jgi:hypothetical protein